MRYWLLKFLGITEILHEQRSLRTQMGSWAYRTERLRLEIGATNRAIGKVVHKLDPNLLVPEDDPARKAASDRLGDEVIKRLKGEFKASNSTWEQQ